MIDVGLSMTPVHIALCEKQNRLSPHIIAQRAKALRQISAPRHKIANQYHLLSLERKSRRQKDIPYEVGPKF